jgi:hypothetical protein
MAEQGLVQEVGRLRSQGMSNDQVAQRLLYQGYTNADVFDAMSQADVTPAHEGSRMEAEMSISPRQEMADTSRISEIAESIIEEKWSDLVDHVNKIIEWKSAVELKVAAMDEQIKNLKSEFEIMQKGVLGKISDTDSTMREVSTDIKALEQVFKKILPGFVENVNELSRITQRMKK